jgi:GTPase SAR1 family protein
VQTSNVFFLQCSNLVYDVTRRETFTNLVGTWAKEVGLYSTNQDCIKILVGNKVDKVNIMVYGMVLHSLLTQEKTENHTDYVFSPQTT